MRMSIAFIAMRDVQILSFIFAYLRLNCAYTCLIYINIIHIYIYSHEVNETIRSTNETILELVLRISTKFNFNLTSVSLHFFFFSSVCNVECTEYISDSQSFSAIICWHSATRNQKRGERKMSNEIRQEKKKKKKTSRHSSMWEFSVNGILNFRKSNGNCSHLFHSICQFSWIPYIHCCQLYHCK